MKIFYSWQELVEMKARDAAGINSPHNACQFRADCRKAEAEIALLRESIIEHLAAMDETIDDDSVHAMLRYGKALDNLRALVSARKETK